MSLTSADMLDWAVDFGDFTLGEAAEDLAELPGTVTKRLGLLVGACVLRREGRTYVVTMAGHEAHEDWMRRGDFARLEVTP